MTVRAGPQIECRGNGRNSELAMTPREAARMLHRRLDYVYTLIWAGLIPAEKKDGRWFITASVIKSLAERRRP